MENNEIQKANEGLASKILVAPVDGRTWLVQTGRDENGAWMKAKFAAKGATYLFRPEEMTKAMAKSRREADEESGSFARPLAEKTGMEPDSFDATWEGAQYVEQDLVKAFAAGLSAVVEERGEQTSPYDLYRDGFAATFLSDTVPSDTEKYDVMTKTGVFGRWYDAGFEPGRGHVWRRAAGPLNWYGRRVVGEGRLDDPETTFSEMWPDEDGEPTEDAPDAGTEEQG